MKYKHYIAVVVVLLLATLLLKGVAFAQGPEVTTNPATNVTSGSATLNGNLTNLGNYSWAYVSFEWGGNITYGNETTPGNMTTTGSFSANISGLSPNTTYHFRAKALGNGTDPFYGNDATFTTATSINLQGWGWCTNYNQVVQITFDGYTTMVERSNAPSTYSMHMVGNLTLTAPYSEIIPLDMYGNRVRLLFYLREEVTGKSVHFNGTWIGNTTGNGTYIGMGGWVTLPNPQGQVLKTARICFIVLRTPNMDVPLTQSGNFVQDIDSMISRFAKFVNATLDTLVGSGFAGILSSILQRIAVLLAHLRALGIPYIT
jgi:hypothetical protein